MKDWLWRSEQAMQKSRVLYYSVALVGIIIGSLIGTGIGYGIVNVVEWISKLLFQKVVVTGMV